ncbi:hypothetical protein B0H10DRAFT_2314 [Mycena sp. CBHHK59/15]|nr:hypothetical protein B0H10DRAFT_2314 [Mycena sp. CBHHK59/15]
MDSRNDTRFWASSQMFIKTVSLESNFRLHRVLIELKSGTAFWGMFLGEIIHDDSNADQIESLAPTQPHRDVDLEIINADKEGYIKSYIILFRSVYGPADGKFIDTMATLVKCPLS